ncbi:MAG TPA: MBL fold metallo-hydrolase [Planctomycetota bacterium]|nr:MBL fold metallo-hydrolase [Planctomycetota bacterium]
MQLILVLCSVAAFQASDKIATAKGDLEIVPIDHATFVLKWDKAVIFVDPVGGAAKFKDHGKPDLILVTDIHGDHLDAKTVEAVKGEKTMIVAPQACADKLGAGVSVLANGAKTKCGEVEIEAVPMYNLTPERKNNHTKGRGNGYVLTIGGKRIYVSGDTEDIPEMRALKGIDAAFVCMILPYTMDVDHAADAVLAFKPKVVYPYHYRGKEGMSDVAKFKSLVAKDKAIEVRLLKWY